MVRAAVRELGDSATDARVPVLVAERFGEDIGPWFIPLFRATLRGEEQLSRARERAAKILAEDRDTRRCGPG